MDNKQFELSNDELEAISGGLEVPIVGRQQITTCDDFVCLWCGCGKATPSEKSHICAAQSGPGRTPSERIESVFENICHWCAHERTCTKAYTWVGLGSPTP